MIVPTVQYLVRQPCVFSCSTTCSPPRCSKCSDLRPDRWRDLRVLFPFLATLFFRLNLAQWQTLNPTTYVVSFILDSPWDLIRSHYGAVRLVARCSICHVRSSLGCSTLRDVLSDHDAVQLSAELFVGIVPWDLAEKFLPRIERGSV